MNDKSSEVRQEERSAQLRRHQSQCSVCSHPKCQEIEEAWTHWGNTILLADTCKLSKYSIYRHMHARGLFIERQKNVKGVYERIIERMDLTSFGASNIMAALKAYTSLCEREEERKQANGLPVKALFRRMSKQEREAFARDGSLPEWFLDDAEATPEDSPDGEGEIPADATAVDSEGATPKANLDGEAEVQAYTIQEGSEGATPTDNPRDKPEMAADAAQENSEGATPKDIPDGEAKVPTDTAQEGPEGATPISRQDGHNTPSSEETRVQ